MIISLTVQRSMRKMNMPIKRWRKYWMVRPGSIFIICRWENYFAVPFYYMSITALQIYVSEINLTIPIFQHDVIVIECRQENGTLMTPHRYLWTLIVSVLAVMHLLGLLFSCGECSKYGLPITLFVGYGARWTYNGQSFRGFLEPQMVDGHEVGWRHWLQMVFYKEIK